MIRFERILCPTDFSEASTQSFTYAVDLARQFDAEVVFVHVLAAVPVDVTAYAFETGPSECAAARRAHAEEWLDALIHNLDGAVRARRLVVQGNPAETILDAADGCHADLIVIATHGATGWRHLFFGSVAEKVVRLARTPVLTVSARCAETVARLEKATPAAAVH